MSAPNPQKHYPETAGYPPLGDLMGAYPVLAIFRRFRQLGALDLLYRQSEIQSAANLWFESVEKDCGSTHPKRQFFHIKHECLVNSWESDGESSDQRRRWRAISKQLDEYYARLLRFRQICELPSADKAHLDELERLLRLRDGGAAGFMTEFEPEIYGGPNKELNEKDLTSVAAQSDPDLFARFAKGPITTWFHRIVYGEDSRHTLAVPKVAGGTTRSFYFRRYSAGRLTMLSRFMVSLLTAGCVTLAIVLLNYFGGSAARVILIFVNNLLFSVAMAILARARAAEVFGLSAAYAAVLVVYASGPSGLFGKPDA